MLQMGNCGSPIETPQGWLLLTHAVGPMRKYVLSHPSCKRRAALRRLYRPSAVGGAARSRELLLCQPWWATGGSEIGAGGGGGGGGRGAVVCGSGEGKVFLDHLTVLLVFV